MIPELLKLRIRTPVETHWLEMSRDTPVIFLLEEISKVSKFPMKELGIRAGYPPKLLSIYNMEMSIWELGIRNQMTLNVEKDETQGEKSVGKAMSGSKPEISGEMKKRMESIGESQIPDKEGMIMVRRIIKADNSCLFNAIAYTVEKSLEKAEDLRNIIGSFVLSDPNTFDANFLGREPAEYIHWIQKSTSWGGAVEIIILTMYYQIEVAVLNIQTLSIHLFGQGKQYNNRVYLLYDGIHYDYLGSNIFQEAPKTSDTTIFSSQNQLVYQNSLVLGKELYKKNDYTNLQGFLLKCGECFELIKGQKEAVEHSITTGHTNFQEIK